MSEGFWSELWTKILGLLKSRKFWATVIAVVVLVFGERAGIDQETLLNAVYVIVAFIFGTALEDAGRWVGGKLQ